MNRIVFSDVDGTLLTSRHTVSENTRAAILVLKNRQIPFVIVSARSPSGIETIVNEVEIDGGIDTIVAYSGGLVMCKGNVLYSSGIDREIAREVLELVDNSQIDAAWCMYSYDQWLVRDRTDQRITTEENIVKALSSEGTVEDIIGDVVHKIMYICKEPAETDRLETLLKEKFPQCGIVKSCATQLEVMHKGTNKGEALRKLCEIADIPVEYSLAFGDNYNDVKMLEAAGMGYIMANAPEDLKNLGFAVAKSNDEDGVFYALKELNLI